MTADDDSDGRTVAFSVPRPEVVALRGLDPVVFVEVPDHHRNFSGAITSWEPLQDDPCTVVKVTMDMGRGGQGRDEVMRWSSNVSEANAAAMQQERTESLRASEEGRVYRRDREQ